MFNDGKKIQDFVCHTVPGNLFLQLKTLFVPGSDPEMKKTDPDPRLTLE
jgi:hypothetical protein